MGDCWVEVLSGCCGCSKQWLSVSMGVGGTGSVGVMVFVMLVMASVCSGSKLMSDVVI